MINLTEKFKEIQNDTISTVHIISRGNKWAVRKKGAKRALRLFKYKELAFLYACKFGERIVVHDKDAYVLYVFNNDKEWKQIINKWE